MSQFVFPPLTANLNSEGTNGGSLPSSVLVVAGYDGANVRAIKTDSTGEVQVDISSSALPSGAATAALQTAGNNLLTTIDADTSSLAGAVSGTEMQVDVVASLPAGTNAIGKLAANSGVDIGDVDVTSIVPGVGATNLGKAIQSAQGATDVGIAALVVRNDTLADLSGADGDYSPLQVNATGALYTSLATSIPAGTNAIGKLAANSGVDIGDVDVTSLPSIPAGTNSIGTVILGAGTAAIGKLAANSGVDIGDVDVTSLPALPSGTNTIGKVDVNAIAPVDFLDSGLVDTSTANIASTGTTVVSSLAAACTEIEIQEDIGEFMSLRVGGTVKAYLPLGGGRVKVSLAATDAVQLFSETGTAISSGKIAINFLG